ncbi:DNA-formamidopyrimidine glycosylase family protein [Nonomuraea sp. NPDC001023]|uniref:DNA-formamidopyrimidine glycosylase family protein n=1 Tax=unclassified Nonomuraea TaxID=2593643 RepID=UPI00332D6F37
MPEGHLIHRHAAGQHADLAGRTVLAAGPQGRFDARPWDGRVLTEVEALGKHLLYHFADAPTVHVHLGMRGIFLRYDDPGTSPRPGTRLRLATGEVAYDLIAAVLDQKVWSGIGNAWRAELLFLVGLHPNARGVRAETAGRLWDAAVRYLALGRDAGQVVSDPEAPSEVYRREHCRSCGAPVLTWQLASRTAYSCPMEQPERP